MSLYKPPSGQPDGPAGVEGEQPQAISLDLVDEADPKASAMGGDIVTCLWYYEARSSINP